MKLVMEEKIKIILADDHEIYREGLKIMLGKIQDFEVIAEASNGRELLNLANLKDANIILLDIRMPDIDGVEAAGIILKKYPFVKIIGLSMYYGFHYLKDMVDAGVDSFLLKNTDKNEIEEAVRTVANGERFIPLNGDTALFK